MAGVAQQWVVPPRFQEPLGHMEEIGINSNLQGAPHRRGWPKKPDGTEPSQKAVPVQPV